MTQVQRSETEGPVIARLSPDDSVRRSFDANDINPILNHPEVFPAISLPGMKKIDAAGLVENPFNVLMMSEGGGILFIKQEPHIYDVHTNFLPKHRGRHAIRASLAAYRWMFTHSDCEMLQTKVPAFNKVADLFCKIVGARLEFTRKNVWPTQTGDVDLKYYTLKLRDWIWRTPELVESGVRFHKRLDEERLRHGVTEENHPDDYAHDVAVGACCEMIYGGEPEKGAFFYNQLAKFAGYGTISIVSRNPLLIDIGNAVLQVEGESFKVLLVKS